MGRLFIVGIHVEWLFGWSCWCRTSRGKTTPLEPQQRHFYPLAIAHPATLPLSCRLLAPLLLCLSHFLFLTHLTQIDAKSARLAFPLCFFKSVSFGPSGPYWHQFLLPQPPLLRVVWFGASQQPRCFFPIGSFFVPAPKPSNPNLFIVKRSKLGIWKWIVKS